MTKFTGTYETTWESTDSNDTVVGSADLRFHFTVTPGCAAHMGSLTYMGHPAEPPEIEITSIEQDMVTGWIPVEGRMPDGSTWWYVYHDWVLEEHFEAMIDETRE